MNLAVQRALNAAGLGALPMDKSEWKIQTKEVSHAVATTAGTYDTSIEFDTAYEKVIGVALVERSDGDQSYYNVGLQDNNGRDLIELMDKTLLQASSSQGQSDKFQVQGFDIVKGASFKIRTQIPATVATDAVAFQLAFILYRGKNPNNS